MKYGCLGPETNSVIATKKRASSIDKLVYFRTMELVFQALYQRKIDRAIVPVRNKITGYLKKYKETIDEYFKIEDEFTIPIFHCLASNNGGIGTIMSHPEVLKQCKNYLDANYPDAERQVTNSTAEAAKIVSETKKGAAIANPQTCEHYGLEIIAQDIVKDNYSTFVVLRK